MKYLIALCCLFASFSVNVFAYEERNLLQLKESEHPLQSVLLNNQEWVKFPGYKDRAGWDKLTASGKDGLVKAGEKYLNYEWKAVRATDYLAFTRTGDRTVMESRYNANLNALTSLFLAEMAEGKGRFMDQLVNGIFHTCEMTSWSLSAHVGVQRAKGSLPDHSQQIIDLVAGDVGASLSWIYFFLNKELDKISPLISKRIYDEIESRIFVPYLDESAVPWWMGFGVTKDKGMVNNWNTWCNSNVLQCFLLVDKDKERMRKAVKRSILSVDKFINYVKADGACEEGPAYWGHAAGKLCDYLELLSDATAGNISIFDDVSVRNMGEYISRSYVADDWVVNFADAAAKLRPDSRLIYRFGKLVGSDEMMQFAAYLKTGGRISAGRDLYRSLHNLETETEMASQVAGHTQPAYTWYEQTEFCYMTDKNVFFAAKGGNNDESHNHNDIGTFSLYVDNYPVFIDAGVGTYTRQTFSGERYKIWCMQSNYHNLPLINGISQQNGKSFKATGTRFDSRKKTFSLDISKAYPSSAGIKEWRRTYKLSKNSLDIEDKFDITSPEKTNTIHFMVWNEPDVTNKGVVRIRLKDRIIDLKYDSKLFTADKEIVEMTDKRLANVWGDKLYRISLRASALSKKGVYKYSITFGE